MRNVLNKDDKTNCLLDGFTYSVQVGVGIGVQGGKGLCSPPVRSDKEYLMLVYSRPLILLFCREERTDEGLEERGSCADRRRSDADAGRRSYER